jgi:hypothetical protein
MNPIQTYKCSERDNEVFVNCTEEPGVIPGVLICTTYNNGSGLSPILNREQVKTLRKQLKQWLKETK